MKLSARPVALALSAALLLQACAHAPPSIGVGAMSAEGVITLQLVARGHGATGDAVLTYKPGDPDYDDVRSHVGLKPGDSGKPVLPWR